MNPENLFLAMAPIDDVISCFEEKCHHSGCHSLDIQNKFAALITKFWNADYGPSMRYMKSLIRAYISRLERAAVTIESDGLMDCVARISLQKARMPQPEESSYLCFELPHSGAHLLKIRVYPYHNDVAVRLWEAGTTLANYFLENPTLVENKRIIELGAGVGLTGLVVAGCCNAENVYLTDYTDACLTNIAHNVTINSKWLQHFGKSESVVFQGRLDWSTFLDDKAVCEMYGENCWQAFDTADILFAADVIYDVDQLEALVSVVLHFMKKSPQSKRVIFAITRRNMTTFHTFLELLEKVNIGYDLLWSGDTCEHLQDYFPCKFVQTQADVRIVSLNVN